MSEKKEKSFEEFLREELAADPELARAVEEERLHADIAEQIVKLRLESQLTQKDLAELVKTKQSVISRIEDADYSGHSLSLLERIAHVMRKRLWVLFCDPDVEPILSDSAVAANTTARLTNLELGCPPEVESQWPADRAYTLAFPQQRFGNIIGPSSTALQVL